MRFPIGTTGRVLLVVASLSSIAASGCDLGGSGTDDVANLSATVKPKPVPGVSTTGASVTWFRDGLNEDWFVFEREDPSPSVTPTFYTPGIWRVKPDGTNLEQLPLPDHPGCVESGFYAPERLPDGRMGYIVLCAPSENSAVPSQAYMMAYDFKIKQVAPLLDYALPKGEIGTGGFSWNPEMTRGISGDGFGRYLNEQLYWFTPTGSEPLDVGFPVAYGPSWSPDGERIAFTAAPGGLLGVSVDSPKNLYLMDTNGANVHPLVKGVLETTGVSWSPDGRWLVFEATIGKKQGLWVVDAGAYDSANEGSSSTDSTPHLLLGGRFISPRWSPDGQQVVVLQYTHDDLTNLETQILRVEVGAALEELNKTPTK
jgi:hypothetical protein